MRFLEFYQLNEDTINDLKNNADKKTKKLSKLVRSELVDVGKNWELIFHSIPVTTKNQDYWTQIVKPKKIVTGKKSLKELRTIFDDDVLVKCDDPSQLYKGFQYIGTIGEYVFKKDYEYRPPVIKNPKLQGTVCKHLINVMEIIKANLPKAKKLYDSKY